MVEAPEGEACHEGKGKTTQNCVITGQSSPSPSSELEESRWESAIYWCTVRAPSIGVQWESAIYCWPEVFCLYSIQFSHSVVSDSLGPHGLQHPGLPCPSSTLGVYLNSCSLSRWCHSSISSSVVPFFSRLQSLPATGTFPMRWPKYWNCSFNISPSNEYSGLIPFRMDWVDLPAVQGTLKSLLQHYSSKASILRCSAFFIIQLSHPYMTTGKTIALIRQTFVGKVMSLLFNMLSRLVIAFLPRSKRLLISWLQSPSAVILE